MEPCASVWLDWDFHCALEDDHSGPHYGVMVDRIAYWGGGGVSEWSRT